MVAGININQIIMGIIALLAALVLAGRHLIHFRSQEQLVNSRE